jgi:hypothetical protein
MSKHYKQGYYAQRIGGIPSALKREGEVSYQRGQFSSMKEAQEYVQRMNLADELRRQDADFR